MKPKKLVVVSNRLPVSVAKINGELVFKHSDGGLATGLASAGKDRQKLWIGWPGIATDDLTEQEQQKITRELKKHQCIPVFLTKIQIDNYYLGYSNATLWPLFHYFMVYAQHQPKYWETYQEVNQHFADVIVRVSDKHCDIWVHDYQLMLVPRMLRSAVPDITIGFFLHIPFPSFEIFRLLPNRAAILEGMLGADLIGFHTYSYARHFLSSVLRVMGSDNELGIINHNHRFIRADAFPIGIDYQKFSKAPKRVGVQKEIASLKKFYRGSKIILSLDRMDYTKGILERLKAYDMFLRDNPNYISKVVMIMVAIPSRIRVPAYVVSRRDIEQLVSRINGKYATMGWSPISYHYRSVSFEELIALYAEADVALITPLRDGLNLVAKEYVATCQDGLGVLILSEMAGVASELPEATLVNPNNQERVAEAIKTALEMPAKDQKDRMTIMQDRISNYDIRKWTNDFLTQLGAAKKYQKEQLHKGFTTLDKRALLSAYKKAKTRLLLLDYDGTLVSFASDPSPASSAPTKRLKQILKRLKKTKKDEVLIVSGRPKTALEEWFGDVPISLVAEHGGWIKTNGVWETRHAQSQKQWKKTIQPILDYYVDRTAGSMVEEKDFALVWHYRKVFHSLAGVRKAELRHDIELAIQGTDLALFEGDKIFEIKPKHIHKGTIASHYVEQQSWDFVLSIGDDYTDEDMFAAVPSNGYTIKVGFGQTAARYHVASPVEVVDLLEELSKL